ncbi:MAG: hypothetical protein AAF126_25225, partial [Chloroflexota bacterium]
KIFGYEDLESEHRSIGVRVFDGKIWLDFWSDPHGWGPRRDLVIDPMQIVFGRMKLDKVLLSDTLTEYMPMPEKDYELEMLVWRYTYWRPRLPFWKDVVKIIEVECEEGIPIPGKGESSRDLDDDAIFSMSGHMDETIPDTLNKWREDIIKRRERYGGTDWQPATT